MAKTSRPIRSVSHWKLATSVLNKTGQLAGGHFLGAGKHV
jgi:hypothetical protein